MTTLQIKIARLRVSSRLYQYLAIRRCEERYFYYIDLCFDVYEKHEGTCDSHSCATCKVFKSSRMYAAQYRWHLSKWKGE